VRAEERVVSYSVDHLARNRNARTLVSETTLGFADLGSVNIADSSAGAFTVFLPDVVGSLGQTITVKCVGANNVTIDGEDAEEIDGALTLVLTDGQVARLYADGVMWRTI
jgi:hypothetical protein